MKYVTKTVRYSGATSISMNKLFLCASIVFYTKQICCHCDFYRFNSFKFYFFS